MSASRTLPPPFCADLGGTAMKLGYVWDTITFPPTSTFFIGVGFRKIGLTFEELQRWQCRLGYWDLEAPLIDPTGGNPDITKIYGTPAPTDSFTTLFSREMGAYNSDPVAISGSAGGGTIGLTFQIILGGLLCDESESLFYPDIRITGTTWISTDIGDFFLNVSSAKGGSDWVDFGTADISNAAMGTLHIPIFREPNPGMTVNALYELDYFRTKPTQYILS